MNNSTCSVDGCTSPSVARGWCSVHYNRWHKTGDVQAEKPIRWSTKQLKADTIEAGCCLFCGEVLVGKRGPGRPKQFCSTTCQRRERSRVLSAQLQAARKCECGRPATNERGRARCDECRLAARLRVDRGRTLRPYGITVDEYDVMLGTQGGKCAICGTDDPGQGRPSFCVDHDHETNAVRGLLCITCNLALGYMRDDPALLRAAIAYLDR